MSLELYTAYLVACFIVVIIPGPTQTLILANSLAHGTRAGLLNVAGGLLGLGVLITLVAIGLASLIEALGWWFDLVRLAGAAYLVWLGWKLLRMPIDPETRARARPPRGGFLLQGFIVVMSNPKALVFFGAFFPQFIDARADYAQQIVLLGLTAIAFAAVTDTAYAVLTGRAGRALTRNRIRLMTRASGGILIGGGVWLALARSR